MWGTCGSVTPYALRVPRARPVPLHFSSLMAPFFQVCTLVAQGVLCHFFAAWRWLTEGAQGVLSCPLGITELSEPVSVDIYLHPIYIHLRKQLLYTLATLLRCSVVAQLRQCTGARGERVIGDVVT